MHTQVSLVVIAKSQCTLITFKTILGEFIGFTNVGSVNKEIQQLSSSASEELELATHILSFMARGIFNSLEFTVAHFPTKSITNDKLYFIVWSVISAMEGLGFKV